MKRMNVLFSLLALGAFLAGTSAQASQERKNRIVTEVKGDVVTIMSCDQQGVCQVVGSPDGFRVQGLQQKIRSQKIKATGVAAAAVAIPVATFVGSFFLKGYWDATHNSTASLADEYKYAAASALTVAAIEGGVALLFPEANPVARWKKANRLADLLKKKELEVPANDLTRSRAEIEKLLKGTPSATDPKQFTRIKKTGVEQQGSATTTSLPTGSFRSMKTTAAQ